MVSVLESISYETDLKIDLSKIMGDKAKQLFADLLNNSVKYFAHLLSKEGSWRLLNGCRSR